MRNKTTPHIRTYVAGARAHCKKVDILHGSSGCLYTVQNSAATCLHGPAQIALIQLIGTLAAIQSIFQIKMAMINITIQEDLSNALTPVARRVKCLFLGEPKWWVRSSDTENPRMVH